MAARVAKGVRRSGGTYTFVGVSMGLAALSQVWVQTFASPGILERAKQSSKFTQTIPDKARRGAILDTEGKPLAKDDDLYRLEVDFRKVPLTDAFFLALAAASGVPASEISQFAYAKKLAPVEWRRAVSSYQAEQIRQVKSDFRADGLALAPSNLRENPLGEAAGPLLGFIRRDRAVFDKNGRPIIDPMTRRPKQIDELTGLEERYNSELSGQDGKVVGLVDRSGSILPMRLEGTREKAVNGQDVQLTIDTELQQVAYEAVRDQVLAFNAERGTAVVQDPSTGDFLAIVAFRNPKAPDTVPQLDVHPAFSARLDPGSIFKVFTVAKAYEDGVLKPTDVLHCDGAHRFYGRTIHCDFHHGEKEHGYLTPDRAIAKSCNIIAAQWADRIGRGSYMSFLDKLGFLRATDIGVKGEIGGFINPDDPAKELQNCMVGFGQSVTITPVGICSALSMIANGGTKMKPRLIKAVGGVERPTAVDGTFLRPEVSEEVLKCMEAVIESEEGTGKHLRIPGYRLGGKTGTAQRRNEVTHTMKGGGYCSNFIGFVPGEHPRATIVVMVEGATKAKFGSVIAGPAFERIAKAIIKKDGIPPTENVGP